MNTDTVRRFWNNPTYSNFLRAAPTMIIFPFCELFDVAIDIFNMAAYVLFWVLLWVLDEAICALEDILVDLTLALAIILRLFGLEDMYPPAVRFAEQWARYG